MPLNPNQITLYPSSHTINDYPASSGSGGSSGSGSSAGANLILDPRPRAPKPGESIPYDPVAYFAFKIGGLNKPPIPVPAGGQCPSGTTYGPNYAILGGGGGLCYYPGTQSLYQQAVNLGYNIVEQFGVTPNAFFTKLQLDGYLCRLGYYNRCPGGKGNPNKPDKSASSTSSASGPTKLPPVSADPLLPGLPSGNTGVVPPVINITPGGTTTGTTPASVTDPIYSVLANLFPAGGSYSNSAPQTGQSFLFADYGGGVQEGGGGGGSIFMVLLLVGLGVAGYFAYKKWG